MQLSDGDVMSAKTILDLTMKSLDPINFVECSKEID
jgi:hypothetical protein